MIYLNYAKDKPEHFHVMFVSIRKNWTKLDPREEKSPIGFDLTTA